MSIDRSIRLSQVVSNYGVGALYDILGESLVLTDTNKWLETRYHGKGKPIAAKRLIHYLKSKDFPDLTSLYEPAKKDSNGSLPFMRFPRWLFCSTCRRMKYWDYRDEIRGESPVCQYCAKHPKLTPMRFITICERGHMGDVPWERWAHSGQLSEHQKTCQSRDLEFITASSGSGGLDSIAVRCRSCRSARTLEGITAPDVLRSIGVWCPGKQPWQSTDQAQHCLSKTHVVQRGAGNVYYPQISSALTIPPESHYQHDARPSLKARVMDHKYAPLLKDRQHEDAFNHVAKIIATSLLCTVSELIQCLDEEENEPEAMDTSAGIEGEEWKALITEMREVHDKDQFVTRHMDIDEAAIPSLPACIDKLVSVIKLREVRALTGFFRYHPGGTEESGSVLPIRPDLDSPLDWLPAVEAFGEGVFLTLNETNLRTWEQLPEVKKRAKLLADRTGHSSLEYFLPTVTPRYILLHTLSHLLIRRLAFECGYSSASLRERIYSSEPGSEAKAGILVYTAAGDSEGTLGGLARQAETKRFADTLLSALQDAANCSTDPICMESKGQGLDTLNLAACHACTLVAETSCTAFNLILDRAMVIGSPDVPGFFQNLLNAALESTLNHQL